MKLESFVPFTDFGKVKMLKELLAEYKTKKTDIKKRLGEFKAVWEESDKVIFSELCFCILTANSKAETAINIQKQLNSYGFCTLRYNDLRGAIKRNKHRFHNNKAKFILAARQFIDIKDIITGLVKGQGESSAREWLVKNIKGLGYKESSHFLRNVGYFNFAILDRHILNLMIEEGLLKEKERPKSLTKKKYLEIEKKFRQLAGKLGMAPAELDLYMWYMKTGKVMK